MLEAAAERGVDGFWDVRVGTRRIAEARGTGKPGLGRGSGTLRQWGHELTILLAQPADERDVPDCGFTVRWWD